MVMTIRRMVKKEAKKLSKFCSEMQPQKERWYVHSFSQSLIPAVEPTLQATHRAVHNWREKRGFSLSLSSAKNKRRMQSDTDTKD